MHGRKRLLTADPTKWKKNKTKKLRMLGKPYVGYSRSKDGVVKHDKPKKREISFTFLCFKGMFKKQN